MSADSTADVETIRARLFEAASVTRLIEENAEDRQDIAGAARLVARIVEDAAAELEGVRQ